MNFKQWINLNEMPHLAKKMHGKFIPFKLGDKFALAIDMKFETYPTSELKKHLLIGNTPFYGQIPKTNQYLVYDGKNLHVIPIDKLGKIPLYVALPDSWWRYAEIHFADGTIKNSKINNEIN